MDKWNKPWPHPEKAWPDNFLGLLREFFATEASRPPGLDIYEDCFQSPLFFPLQRKRELEKMIQLVRRVVGEPRVVMEIGADKGAGFYHWVKCFPSVEKAIAVEIRGTPYASLFEEHFPEVQFLWVEDSSYKMQTVHQVWGFADRLDVLFVDGDKLATRRDCEWYLPIVSNQGLVFIHDVLDEPRDAFRILAQTHRTDRIVDVTESHEAMEREAAGVPIDSAYEQWLRHWQGRSATVGVVYP